MTDYVTATAYAVVKGKRATYGPTNPVTGMKRIHAASIKRIVQNAPVRLDEDEVCVKIQIKVPAAVFDPLMPSAVITVPEDLVERGPIIIEAIEGAA